jgi:spore germination protein GerM
MKTIRALASVVLTVACLTAQPLLGLAAGGNPAGQPRRQKVVKVYFYHDPGEYIDLSPVERKVSAASPARAALEALLRGPTAQERRKGFDSLASAHLFAIGSLKITGGTARVNFVVSRKWLGWSGDTAPIRFRKAVELTLQQFPNVKRVIVSLNGDPRFAEG